MRFTIQHLPQIFRWGNRREQRARQRANGSPHSVRLRTVSRARRDDPIRADARRFRLGAWLGRSATSSVPLCAPLRNRVVFLANFPTEASRPQDQLSSSCYTETVASLSSIGFSIEMS